MHPAVRDETREPTKPGEVLTEILRSAGLSDREAAQLLGIAEGVMFDLCYNDAYLTAEHALRLGRFFGNGEQFWMNMQTAHDLWAARRRVDLTKITPLSK